MHDVYRPTLRLLSPRQVELIVDQAFAVLESVGVLIEHSGAAELLHGAGARMSDDGTRAFLSRDLCERALSTVPAAFTLYDREGDEAATIGGDHVHFDPGSAATLVYDFSAGETRKPATADVIDFVTLTDRLPAYAMQSTGIVPDDVSETIMDRYRLLLALAYGRKPIVTGAFMPDASVTMFGLLAAVRGGADKLREKPLAVFDCCPTSPLKWSELGCQSTIDCARAGIPVNLIPAPLIGATSPVTLEGTIVQHTAENLSGVVIHQTAAPAAPLIYGCAATLFDMRRGTAPMSAVEAQMVDAGCVQIGKHFGLPVHAYLGLSDAKTPDAQAGFETTMGAVVAALAGVNVASGAGMLNYVICQSLEKLLIDSDVCRHAMKLAAGIPHHDDDAGASAIAECAESGSFITSAHTRRYFRGEVDYPGPVIDRLSPGDWEGEGKGSAADRAHAEVRRLLSETEPVLPAGDVLDEMERLVLADARAAGMDELPRWRRP